MTALAHHAALTVSVGALGGAALRVASGWAPSGGERVLAAAALGGSLAVLEALGLGLAGLGGSTPALTAAALATWLLASRIVARPATGVTVELAAGWKRLGPRARMAWGASAAALAWWLVWALLNPSIGFDASLYHYTEVASWVQQGQPGSVEPISYEFPVGNYPLVNEVLMAWGAGLAHSFAPMALWPFAAFTLAGLACWTGLRRLGVPPPVAGLSVAAVLTVPSLVTQVAEPQTDLPALAWLVAAGALVVCARERPGLLTPGLLAAGLAVGTKTTTAVFALALVLFGWRAARGRLPGRELALAGVSAALVGGLWYARNLLTHGSPLWPFAPGPFGDPTPAWLNTIDTKFLERPLATISHARPRELGQRLGAAPLLLIAGLAAPLAARSRVAIAAAAATLVGVLGWMNAPATGLSASPLVWIPEGWPESGTRYLLPVFAAAALSVALVARAADRPARLAGAVLGAVAGGNLVVLAFRGPPFLPPLQLVVAAGVGATLARAWRPPRRRLPQPARAVLACLALAVALVPAASGYAGRHAEVADSSALGSDVVRWMAARSEFRDGDEPVAIVSRAMIAPLAGDRLQHALELVPANEPCSRVRRRLREGWVVASDPRFADGFLGIGRIGASRCLLDAKPAFEGRNFKVYRPL